MGADTAIDTVLVLLIGGVLLYGILAFLRLYQERKGQELILAQRKRLKLKAQYSLKQEVVIEPQMGFPVEPGVQDWQKP